MSAVVKSIRPPAAAPKPPVRPAGNALAQIHIAKAQLGLDDHTYRQMLQAVAGVSSAKDLSPAGCTKVLAHLRRSGFRPTPPKAKAPGRPNNMAHPERGAMLGKIEALLAEAGRPWAYADGIAQRMFKVSALQFCHEGQLHRIVAALVYDQARATKKAAAARGAA